MVAVTEDEIVQFVTGLPGVVAVTASEAGGAPEGTWGDRFFFYDPTGDDAAAQRMPFATIVTQDYAGFDEASDLNRPDVFRLNIGAGRTAFEQLIGHSATAHAQHQDDYDYAARDVLLPHPVYASQGWVCVLNPGETTTGLVRRLLSDAHALAAERHRRRHEA